MSWTFTLLLSSFDDSIFRCCYERLKSDTCCFAFVQFLMFSSYNFFNKTVLLDIGYIALFDISVIFND